MQFQEVIPPYRTRKGVLNNSKILENRLYIMVTHTPKRQKGLGLFKKAVQQYQGKSKKVKGKMGRQAVR